MTKEQAQKQLDRAEIDIWGYQEQIKLLNNNPIQVSAERAQALHETAISEACSFCFNKTQKLQQAVKKAEEEVARRDKDYNRNGKLISILLIAVSIILLVPTFLCVRNGLGYIKTPVGICWADLFRWLGRGFICFAGTAATYIASDYYKGNYDTESWGLRRSKEELKIAQQRLQDFEAKSPTLNKQKEDEIYKKLMDDEYYKLNVPRNHQIYELRNKISDTKQQIAFLKEEINPELREQRLLREAQRRERERERREREREEAERREQQRKDEEVIYLLKKMVAEQEDAAAFARLAAKDAKYSSTYSSSSSSSSQPSSYDKWKQHNDEQMRKMAYNQSKYAYERDLDLLRQANHNGDHKAAAIHENSANRHRMEMFEKQ